MLDRRLPTSIAATPVVHSDVHEEVTGARVFVGFEVLITACRCWIDEFARTELWCIALGTTVKL